MSRILVTGGAGFIGSHTCVALDEAGYEYVVVDDYSNSKPEVINRLNKITNKDIISYDINCCDKDKLRKVFEENDIDAVIHFAGFKAVGESVFIPIDYYRNNLDSLLTVVELMREFKINKLIFSSSATVYGNSKDVPFTEESPLGTCTNPYGWTKWMIEQILTDLAKAYPEMNVVLLRYFNPVGAHKSGLIGEDPQGIPNNLFPNVARAADGRMKELKVFGADYDTPDGTCIRDYIHVCDLAEGHVKALDYLATKNGGRFVFNLGTGHGYSVFEVIKAFSKACGHEVPNVVMPRRPGDIPVCYAGTEKSLRELGFVANRGIDEMCEDTWRWQTNNPNGYDDASL